jgi:hypothetical protein
MSATVAAEAEQGPASAGYRLALPVTAGAVAR